MGVELMAVLKADAYGHGAIPLAKVAVENGASHIGVSSLEEALALREAGISAPVLILGGIYPFENFSVVLEADLIPTIASLESAQQLEKIAREKNRQVPFHLKVDTGMGRIGVSAIGAKKILEWLVGKKSVELAGIFSHLSSADSDPTMTQGQLHQFSQVCELAISMGFKKTKFHISNSAALLRYPEARLNLVRPGLALYGVMASPTPSAQELTPVLSWKTKIIFLKKVPAGTPISYGATYRASREIKIATLPVGYADGIPWSTSNKGFVLIKGRRCPIVGRVTMDHIMVDVTDLPVSIGDESVLIGRQGDAEITAQNWADWAGSISYEILCGISKRVPRVVIS